MKYICADCKYETNDKSNYNKHINSSNHTQKNKKTVQKSVKHTKILVNALRNSPNLSETPKLPEIECNFCGQKFTRTSNLNRHKQICVEAKLEEEKHHYQTKLQEKDKETEIQLLKQKNDFLEKEIKELKAFIKSGKCAPTYNISVKKYIQQKYSDAPHLEKLDHNIYAQLVYEHNHNNGITVNNNVNNDDAEIISNGYIANENDKLISLLVYSYNNDTLQNFLGDFIIKNYKKENPSQQAIWNSDVSRLTYVIKELLSSNTESQWHADYKGVKTKNYIITPLLKHIRQCIDEYWIKSIDSFKTLDIRSLEHLQHELVVLQRIKKDIDNNVLSCNIIKYIAPEFYMNKFDNNGKLIDFEI